MYFSWGNAEKYESRTCNYEKVSGINTQSYYRLNKVGLEQWNTKKYSTIPKKSWESGSESFIKWTLTSYERKHDAETENVEI